MPEEYSAGFQRFPTASRFLGPKRIPSGRLPHLFLRESVKTRFATDCAA